MVATATYDGDEEGAVTLVNCVADVRGTEPTDLEPIQETIDVDALTALVDSAFRGECAFTYAGCEVTVGGDGSIRVQKLAVPEQ